MTDLLIGRQPIFDRSMNVYAYELLYRSDQANQASFLDGDQATLRVMLNALMEIGLENIVGESKAFINMTRNFLMGRFPIPLPTQRMVVEVLEDVSADAALIEAVREMYRAGFMIALDDVSDLSRIDPFLDCHPLIKLDLMQIDHFQLPEIAKGIKMRGLRMLAEKVETQAEYLNCRQLGFDYFQGYFLCKPNILRGKKMESSRMVIMQSLASLQNPETSFSDLENVLSRDIALSYKILRLANSGYYSFPTEVVSLRQAIALIGLDMIRGWMSLLMMSSLQDKPHELTTIALQRARMSESLARVYGQQDTGVYFLVGLFSVLDAMMDQAMPQILSEINLSAEVKDALLNYGGLAGQILYGIQAYEKGDWNTVMMLNLPAERINSIYLDSVKWANVLNREIMEATQIS